MNDLLDLLDMACELVSPEERPRIRLALRLGARLAVEYALRQDPYDSKLKGLLQEIVEPPPKLEVLKPNLAPPDPPFMEAPARAYAGENEP